MIYFTDVNLCLNINITMQPVNNYFYHVASIRFDESPCNLIG